MMIRHSKEVNTSDVRVVCIGAGFCHGWRILKKPLQKHSWLPLVVSARLSCVRQYWGSRNSGTAAQEKETTVVGHVEQMEGKRLQNAALRGHVEQKRSRGRQRKPWM